METNYLENRLRKLFIFLPIFIWFIDFNRSNEDFTFCMIKNLFGYNCYGCGFLRGASAALHFQFDRMVELNSLNLITVPLATYLYFKFLKKSFKK